MVQFTAIYELDLADEDAINAILDEIRRGDRPQSPA